MSENKTVSGVAPDAVEWYSDRFEMYSSFTRLLHATVENLIRAAGIDCLSVTSRTKSVASFVEKMKRKGYESTEEATDLAGVRVITFIESDAAAAAHLLRGCFTVHPERSLDKSEELGDSQVGYRSIHLICELEKGRAALPEYKPFKGLLFEVQVRTVLQHAWAEIDHDRGYKFNGVLPRELRRRLNLLAGQLEQADNEFSRLAGDVDRYSAELQEKNRAGDLNIELSSASLLEFLTNPTTTHSLPPVTPSTPSHFATVIDELHRFGIDTLEGVRELMSSTFLNDVKALGVSSTQVGLLRKAMMYADIDKYFTEAWSRQWRKMTLSTRLLMKSRWGEEKLGSIERTFLVGRRARKAAGSPLPER
jgi:putative GTP pyrophosphokinase